MLQVENRTFNIVEAASQAPYKKENMTKESLEAL
jgi:hypothetical protein